MGSIRELVTITSEKPSQSLVRAPLKCPRVKGFSADSGPGYYSRYWLYECHESHVAFQQVNDGELDFGVVSIKELHTLVGTPLPKLRESIERIEHPCWILGFLAMGVEDIAAFLIREIIDSPSLLRSKLEFVSYVCCLVSLNRDKMVFFEMLVWVMFLDGYERWLELTNTRAFKDDMIDSYYKVSLCLKTSVSDRMFRVNPCQVMFAYSLVVYYSMKRQDVPLGVSALICDVFGGEFDVSYSVVRDGMSIFGRRWESLGGWMNSARS